MYRSKETLSDTDQIGKSNTSKRLVYSDVKKHTQIKQINLAFVYRTADTSCGLDSTEIYTSCSVHKCEWHSISIVLFFLLLFNFDGFYKRFSNNVISTNFYLLLTLSTLFINIIFLY